MDLSIPLKPSPHLPSFRRLTVTRDHPAAFGRTNRSSLRRFVFLSPPIVRGPLSCSLGAGVGSGGGYEESSSSGPTNLPVDTPASKSGVSPESSYVGLFVRMLGLDNDPLDREQAVVTLWKYAQGGKDCVDEIMRFPGCINLIVNLLKSDSSSACEAAAGLLRTIASVNVYRESVAESGAIEEINGLLSQSSLVTEVKEQSVSTLWNLSVDEKLRMKIANSDLLPLLVKFLDDEEIKVVEAAGGTLANLALSQCNHSIMVDSGVIPKMVELLKRKIDGYKVIRKEIKNVLLELSKDEYYRILVIEEGLVLVPLIGSAAYKSFRPASQSWPSLPDGTEFERKSSRPSRYGASELLLGLNYEDKNVCLEELKMNALVGRSQQQFLVRIGAIELEEGTNSQMESLSKQRYTLLPWIDGIARLVLILGLQDSSAIARAAQSVADACINEYMRVSFKEAGAVRYLVQLLNHDDESVRLAVSHALERLSVSHKVCRTIEAEGVLDPLLSILNDAVSSQTLKQKTVDVLARIFDPGNRMKKFHDKQVINGSASVSDTTDQIPEVVDGSSMTTCIQEESIAREITEDSTAITSLVKMLKASSPITQMKSAIFLEYLSASEVNVSKLIEAGIVLGLSSVFQQGILEGTDDKIDLVEAEEAGQAIAAASRLLTKLLNSEQFNRAADLAEFTLLLRRVLKSGIPLHSKDWVAACLVKLQSVAGSDINPEASIDMEVTVYETIPRLVEQMKNSFSLDSREAAVIELNSIFSRGVLECCRAVAAEGGIPSLVKLVDEGSVSAQEASLAILYNLSMDDENHPAIISARAIPVLRRIILSEGPQMSRALRLLRTLPT
ncbi:hypothetical protein QJS10_CPA03g00692 [Acorus calamus]|uniref:ARM repeat superfamily protein n=1 Tax=Acorus calamus TaxID=4465 RepID=A0AAV9F8S8_ACOCL|nr:hypothetical protein QJS10_CPA03g00692 [Acorus calamus]